MKIDQNWIVWNPMKGIPTRCHSTKAEAVEESERLAEANKGYPFYVYKLVGLSIKSDSLYTDIPSK